MTHLFDRGAGFLVVDELDRPIPSPESFSEEQWEFKKVARAFMDREVIPHAKALENKDLNLMRQLMLKAGEQTLLMEIPEAYGGLGLGITTASIVGEEFSREANFSVTAIAHMGIGTLPVVFFGTHEASENSTKISHWRMDRCVLPDGTWFRLGHHGGSNQRLEYRSGMVCERQQAVYHQRRLCRLLLCLRPSRPGSI